MKTILLGIVMALGLIYLRGCSTAPIGSQPDVVSQYPRVSFTEEKLAKVLKMNPAIVRKSDTGMLMVTQPIRNASDDVLYVEYKFVWKDVSGAPVGPEMNWRYMRLEPRVDDVISANATSDAVTDYQIQVRWARK